MSKALKALLKRSIDYAGMFPPAKLSLEQSLANFAGYKSSPDQWMLRGLVVPVDSLECIAIYHSETIEDMDGCLDLCMIGRGGSNAEDFIDGVNYDSMEIACFNDHDLHPSNWTFETKLPDISSELMPIVKQFEQQLTASDLLHYAHLELPDATLEAVASLITCLKKTKWRIGFKLRCGGVQADDFPSSDLVAQVLSICRGVPLKFTAGLHHPLRHYDDEIGTEMHGFINVFTAGILDQKHELPHETIVEILEDRDPDSFRFDDQQMSWRDYSATVEEIESIRDNFPGFGSCSFDEPREDLKALGWL